METKNNTGKFVLGAFVGSLVGGATALLMAPRSGENTQKMILEKGESWRQEAENKIHEGQQYAEGKVTEARQTFADWLSKGSTLLDEKSQEFRLERTKKAKKSKKTAQASA